MTATILRNFMRRLAMGTNTFCPFVMKILTLFLLPPAVDAQKQPH